MHRSHSISFTRAQGIPKCKIGLGGVGCRGWARGVLSVVLDYGLLFVSRFGLCDFIRGGVCTMIAIFPSYIGLIS